MNPAIKRLFAVLGVIATAHTLHAGSATWNLNPTSNNWSTAENWTPPTNPSSETDVATFAMSHVTNVVCAKSPDGEFAHTYVGDIIFAEGAGAYSITITRTLM
jgi:hypothetical protein